jgi:sugar/nucleoside kinase (ribokinase family)
MLLVFGSLTLDIVFPLARLPRPGETVESDGGSLQPGGKGANQAVAAARDEAAVALAGMLGLGHSRVVRDRLPEQRWSRFHDHLVHSWR